MDKKPDYMVLVNGENKLPDGYEDTVERIAVQNTEGITYEIEKKTYEAFLRLQEDVLKEDGIRIELISVYRTVKQQEETFRRYLDRYDMEYALKYVAKPGHSEHHTGIAIDVGIVLPDGTVTHSVEELLQVDSEFLPVQKKLPGYGFILRYPKGKEDVTKIGYEPWHFRYIDSPGIAKEITEKGLCFEEYHAQL